MAWSQWVMLMRRIRAVQRSRLRLRRLRHCFGTWAAVSQLQSAVLAALSATDSSNNQGVTGPVFSLAQPRAHAAVQTSCIHPSLSVVIHRLASRSLLPFLCAWRHLARRCCALRWGRELICARVMRVWAGRSKFFTSSQDHDTEDSNLFTDEHLWSEMISPGKTDTAGLFPVRDLLYSTSNKDIVLAPVSRRCANCT
jgi:hypothetical protein